MAKEKSKKRRESAGDESGAFQRRKRPVRVRSGVADWRNWPWRTIAVTAVLVGVSVSSLLALDDYLRTAERFHFPADGSGLLVSGLERLEPELVQSIFEADYGKPLADVELEERRQALLGAPWIERAVVSRVWPDRVWVAVTERRPVAYARIKGAGGGSLLVDSQGVLLEPLPGAGFELPAADGFTREMSRAERLERVRLIERFTADLDSLEPLYSERIGQLDVTDLKNLTATTVHDDEVIELQFGDELFRRRFEIFLKYVDSWKKQYGKIGWVDLRFEGQVVVQPLGAPQRSKPLPLAR